MQQWHELFGGRRRWLVHRSADPDVAAFHQGLEVGNGTIKKRLIGVRHQSVLQARHEIWVEYLPEWRQCELLPPRDGDACSIRGPLECGDAIIVGGRTVLAQDRF